eukprot:CAMPEP_0116073112 /NCGR_PEP_ID=MMETSP0322-20121206/15005_1 /TAXON_ID=163516 /ORGANISM="Leptocylindrus danicus var. apora, Strain B651" /LENGTH=48 /DNA_ID= /DNA_START= /DNA_END= /DNA_ORIENTATION=
MGINGLLQCFTSLQKDHNNHNHHSKDNITSLAGKRLAIDGSVLLYRAA